MRFIRFMQALVCFLPFLAEAGESTSWLKGISSCDGFASQEATTICRRIIWSRVHLDAMHPRLIADKHGSAVRRELVIIAWDSSNVPHPIWLTMPLRPKSGTTFSVDVLTPGYTVERIRGVSPYKLEFRVTKGAEELRVYGGKHLWIPPTHTKETSFVKLKHAVDEKQYLPFQDHLYHPELVARGLQYLEAVIDRARGELHGVPSRAFPKASLYESYPNEVVLSLIASEQTDPYKLFDEKVPVTLPRESYLLGVLIEIAVHGPDAFAGLCSKARACGLLQFTNTPVPNKKYPGTYTYTYRMCKRANGTDVIERDFVRGARDTANAVKAAVCYLDLENAALPQAARDEYLRDPKRGSIYMLAAYNAGPSWSRNLFMKVNETRSRFRDGLHAFSHETLPRFLFTRGPKYNQETHWYIRKYWWTWDLLFSERDVKVPSPG